VKIIFEPAAARARVTGEACDDCPDKFFIVHYLTMAPAISRLSAASGSRRAYATN
jgi:hypothetical protein